jgi:ribonuclease P protein component
MPSFVKQLSLFTKKEVEAAFASASCANRSPSITILRAPRSKSFGRILIITPKAVGTAPIRNRLRRRIKAIFYENKLYHSLFDWLIISKKGAGEFEYDYLKTLLLKTIPLE